jgi:energy-coupling factor transporter ATP-binding protein EcfA2
LHGELGQIAQELAAYLPTAASQAAESPYKGLLYFDVNDAPLFFGRERVTNELLEHLRQHRFLAVVGASGSGKSSVVRAGVIPALQQGAIEVNGRSSRDWPIHNITPGDEPLKALAATLTRDSESVTATATLLEDLQTSSQSLDLFLYRQMAGQVDTRLLLVIDQFEELFTQCDDPEARRLLVENLVTAVNSGQQARLNLILTLRADFYAQAVGCFYQTHILNPLLSGSLYLPIENESGDADQFQVLFPVNGKCQVILEAYNEELPFCLHQLLLYKRRICCF